MAVFVVGNAWFWIRKSRRWRTWARWRKRTRKMVRRFTKRRVKKTKRFLRRGLTFAHWWVVNGRGVAVRRLQRKLSSGAR
jgi:uncharacterized membrane protein YbaN (DUF454 family)